ncbi:ATP synthase regulation protein NCA2-domain-containing protein [Chytriomyces sp. MP71]|nr:ATP synthase regulation protein NCA2-domain-containing protein [Chytriomyces sp. MP71]
MGGDGLQILQQALFEVVATSSQSLSSHAVYHSRAQSSLRTSWVHALSLLTGITPPIEASLVSNARALFVRSVSRLGATGARTTGEAGTTPSTLSLTSVTKAAWAWTTNPTRALDAIEWARNDIGARAAAIACIRHTQASVLGVLALMLQEHPNHHQGSQLAALNLMEESVHTLTALPSTAAAHARWAYENPTARHNVFEPVKFLALEPFLRQKDTKVEAPPTEALEARIHALEQEVQAIPHILYSLQHRYGTPTLTQQYWVHAIFGLTACTLAASSLSLNARSLRNLGNALYETASGLVETYVFGPLKQMYNTIRHRERRLALLGSDSLSTDLDSLERMCVEFARDHGVAASKELDLVRDRASRGDLSVVLRSYEDDIRHPISGAVRGDLLRSLLIQVQKSKVDLELAMSALDKLLAANELNFTLLSLVPLVALAAGGYTQTRAWLRRRRGLGREQVYEVIRTCLGDVERLLNRSLAPDAIVTGMGVVGVNVDLGIQRLSLVDYGYLRVELRTLQGLVVNVPRRYRERFAEDLEELSHAGWTVAQRMETVKRMGRWYPFLLRREVE